MHAKATLSLTLLLHELGTNAVKYGALSLSGGTVHLRWGVDTADTETEIFIHWTEGDGPPVAELKRRGFGSRLIRMGLAGTGQTNLRYNPTGLDAEFSAPLNVVTDR